MGSIGNTTPSSNIAIEVKDVFGNNLENSGYDNEGQELAIAEAKKSIQEVLEMADGDVDRAYEYLADYYPFRLYDDDATKIIDNRDDQAIQAVEFRLHDMGNGKIEVVLVPHTYSEDEFNTQEELDAIGLYERR